MISFNSAHQLNIDTSPYMVQYEKVFSHLIHQKNKDRTAKVERIMTEIKEIGLFKVEGTDDFKEKFDASIKKLLEVKPGRVLIKELTALKKLRKNPITIQAGNDSRCYPSNGLTLSGVITLNLNKSEENNYNALLSSRKVVCSADSSIVLARLLIHKLHDTETHLQMTIRQFHADQKEKMTDEIRTLPDSYSKFPVDSKLYFRGSGSELEGFERSLNFANFGYPEMQHTILGVNIPRYLKRGNLSRTDVLCENAFLCAFSLPPRSDSLPANGECIEDNTLVQEHLPSYYEWLKNQLDERNKKILTPLLDIYQ